jgi:uncharacterized damage-inducible protein DinB
MSNTTLKKYLHQLQQTYYGGNWLDESFEKKLKFVNEENAFVKPDGYIHSIAEVTSHIVEWRKELLERFEFGRHARLTMESPNNWFPNDLLKKKGWTHLKQELTDTQEKLMKLLETKDDFFLQSKWSGDEDYEWLLAGLIQHDVYHLGQIGLIYKMATYRSNKN